MTNTIAASRIAHDPAEFLELNDHVNETVANVLKNTPNAIIARTSVQGEKLFRIYRDNLPENRRQEHNCNCCRRFFKNFGNLVAVAPNGTVTSLFFDAQNDDGCPELYLPSMRRVKQAVERSPINALFATSDCHFGVKEAGGFHHFYVPFTLSAPMYRDVAPGAEIDQYLAKKKEDHRTLVAFLSEYSTDQLRMAVSFLQSDEAYRAEKVLGNAEFLLVAKQRMMTMAPQWIKLSALWYLVANAPAGWCSPRSNMIGALLSDIKKGLSLEDVKRKFGSKMQPDKYRRTTAAPSEQAIAQANAIFEKSGLSPALERRTAKFDEVQKLWVPPPVDAPQATAKSGPFDRVRQKQDDTLDYDAPFTTVTWVKFARDLLPKLLRLEIQLSTRIGIPACFLTTQKIPDAPPLIMWDQPEQRNPFAWYFKQKNLPPVAFGMVLEKSTAWVRVDGITLLPHLWAGDTAYPFQKDVVFMLRGLRDTMPTGNALFSEILPAKHHAYRHVIEAFAKTVPLHDVQDGDANGVTMVGTGIKFIAETASFTVRGTIDRWE